MRDIILFWIQWSWKGTQATNITQAYPQYKVCEMGNILRALGLNKNMLGDYAKKMMLQWSYLPDSVINPIFEAAYATLEKGEYMLLDWFPRKPDQLDYFFAMSEKFNRDYLAIELVLSEEAAIYRASQRKICISCGAIYNTLNDGDIQICTQCGGSVSHREDDTPEAIKDRIQQHYYYTKPLLSAFEQRKKLVRINADRSVDDVFQSIRQIIG